MPGNGSSFLGSLVNVGGTLLFAADDGVHGQELWRSDGTAAGTIMVKDIWPGANSSLLRNFTVVNGRLFFVANDGTPRFSADSSNQIWVSDGTASGTFIIKLFPPTDSICSTCPLENLANVNRTLFFTFNRDLWKTDGTEPGTSLVFTDHGALSHPTALQGTLFFTVKDRTNNANIWKSDGTPQGTVLASEALDSE